MSTMDSAKELTAALHRTSGQVEVTKSLYWHFLEVLPPRVMGTDYFIFQEGDGERLHFSQLGDKYFCYLISSSLVSEDWRTHVLIWRDRMCDSFVVRYVHSDSDITEVPDRYENIIGERFPRVCDIEEKMGVTFRV